MTEPPKIESHAGQPAAAQADHSASVGNAPEGNELKKKEEVKDKTKKDAHGAEGDKPENGTTQTKTGVEEALKKMLEEYRGNRISAPKVSDSYRGQYLDAGEWKVESEEIDHPTDLGTKEWNHLFMINKCLHGFVLRPQMNGSNTDIVKSRVAAFQFRGGADKGKDWHPEFEVFDNSSIDIREATSELEKSLAKNGFSSRSVEVAIKGTTPFASLGVQASYEDSHSSGSGSAAAEHMKEYFATYSFPRARIFLDQDSDIELTSACRAQIDKIRMAYKNHTNTKPSDEKKYIRLKDEIQLFNRRFGHIFATSFQLGGQLHASKYATSTFSSANANSHDSMKAAVAAAFDSKFFSASASAGMESRGSQESATQQSRTQSSLAWSAIGGDSRFCANPSLWAGSVGTHWNWRTIEQEEIVPVYKLIDAIDPTLGLANMFREASPSIQKAEKIGKWTRRTKISLIHQGPLNSYLSKGSGEDRIILANENLADKMPLEIQILSAFPKDYEGNGWPALSALQGDWPVFLNTDGDAQMQYAGDKVWRNGYFNGLWCDNDGYIMHSEAQGRRICRWSLRKASAVTDQFDRWKPKEHEKQQIADGDLVYLYCHSFQLGAYRDINDALDVANPVVYDDRHKLCKVFKFDYNLWMSDDLKWDAFRDYDQNEDIDPDQKHLKCMLSRQPDTQVIGNKGPMELDLSTYIKDTKYAAWGYKPATAAKWLSQIWDQPYFSQDQDGQQGYGHKMRDVRKLYLEKLKTFKPAAFKVQFIN